MHEDIQMLKAISDKLIAGTDLGFKRYLFPKIDWRNRFVCLKGANVIGKLPARAPRGNIHGNNLGDIKK